MRYDLFVAEKLGISRNKAAELIENKGVCLNENFYKASFDIENLCKNETSLNTKVLNLRLIDEIFVSRGALKLKGFLQDKNIKIKGAKCLDIGAAAGGFTQILLEKGALKVLALDVGRNQLDIKLKNDARVENIEQRDIKNFKSAEKFDIITCDLSFISLKKMLCHIDKFAKCWIILLFKPQFEVGLHAKRDKNGVVKDEKAINIAKIDFEKECEALKWRKIANEASKIAGKEGNVEYFYLYKK